MAHKAAQIWLMSDPHWFHEKLYSFVQWEGGPRVRERFANAAEGDAFMIEAWNAVVKPQHHVWCLGDWTMLRAGKDIPRLEQLTKGLNGHKRLILGNHDHLDVRVYRNIGFQKVLAYHKMDNFMLSHIPLHPTSIAGWVQANLHGHIHAKKSPDPVLGIDQKSQKVHCVPYINLSMEAIQYAPIALEEVQAQVKRIKEAWDDVGSGSTAKGA